MSSPPPAPGWTAGPEGSWRPLLRCDSIRHGEGADPRTRLWGGGSHDPGCCRAALLLPPRGQAGWAGGPTSWHGPCREVGQGSEAFLSFRAPEHPNPGLTSLGWFFWVTGKIQGPEWLPHGVGWGGGLGRKMYPDRVSVRDRAVQRPGQRPAVLPWATVRPSSQSGHPPKEGTQGHSIQHWTGSKARTRRATRPSPPRACCLRAPWSCRSPDLGPGILRLVSPVPDPPPAPHTGIPLLVPCVGGREVDGIRPPLKHQGGGGGPLEVSRGRTGKSRGRGNGTEEGRGGSSWPEASPCGPHPASRGRVGPRLRSDATGRWGQH